MQSQHHSYIIPPMDQIFPTSRFTLNFNLLSVLLYFPFGVVLALARTFLMLNFVCSQFVLSLFLPIFHPIQHWVQRIFLGVLGIVVYKENESNIILTSKPNQLGFVTVCNQNTNIDKYILSCWLNTLVTTMTFSMSSLVQSILRKFPCNSKHHFEKLFEKRKMAILHFPEDCPSSGKVLLKFNPWVFSLGLPIQPCCIKVTRFIQIAPTTIDSNWFADMMWTFFCPVTIYTIKMLPVMHKNLSSETDFANRVHKQMAKDLKTTRTNICLHDRDQYIKLKNVEARKFLINPPSIPQKYFPDDIRIMAMKVQDVLSDVPFDVAANNLQATDCVETTINNLIGGVIKYTPINKNKTEKELRVFKLSPEQRQLSFHERKLLFIQTAREAYLQKHPECKKNV